MNPPSSPNAAPGATPGDLPSSASGASAGRLGLWLVGARGSISSCLAYGLAGLQQGLLEPVGLVTEIEPLRGLGFADWDRIVLGGHDVCERRLSDTAAELVRGGVLSPDLVAASATEAAALEDRIRPGVLDGREVGLADLSAEAARIGTAPPRDQVELIREDLERFQREHELDRVVVVNVASTEPADEERPEWASLEAFEAALDAGKSQPASTIYAYAAFAAGAPHVNFTPSAGASPAALQELALERGLPHCGNDGKTGETLMKTVLAPMFAARGLRVLSWQGYNMLGNRDGEVLRNPVHREAKVRNKDQALRSILGSDEIHSHVGIDYVPSLGDWKTAWDFVHFEGFLGARMSLQFTWQGSDSALAAPLVLDLARLVDRAAGRGESGVLDYTSSFFKSPLGGGDLGFQGQFEALLDYARRTSG